MSEAGKADYVERIFSKLSAIKDAPKEYAYKPTIPRGKLTLIGGEPGVGKTKFALALIAKITAGEPVLGIPCESPGTALIFSTEDDAADIKATITACGGDTDRIYVIGESDEAIKSVAANPITFGSPIVEQAISKIHPSVVLFDPYTVYVGRGVDTFRGNESSSAIAPIIALAKRFNFSLLVIQHFTKGDGPLHSRFAGSFSIIGDSRSAIAIVHDPEAQGEVLAIHCKSNNKTGKTIRYKIESIPGNEDCAKVSFLRLEDYSERDFAIAERRRKKGRQDSAISDSDIIVGTILRLLEDNPSGLRVGRYDFQNCASAYFGEAVSITLGEIETEYSAYLAAKHGIIVQTKPSQALKAYSIKGKIVMPQKAHDRCMHIYRRGTPVQIEA